MPFFGTKKKEVKAQAEVRKGQLDAGAAKHSKVAIIKAPAKVVAKSSKVVSVPAVIPHTANTSVASVIIRPHITEKSGLQSQVGVYTFVIASGVNKEAVAKAIKALYKVTPIRVATIKNPAKKVFVRGKRGSVPGIRKAIVTLKKGDKIDFI